jgi:hypothetical protein
MHPELQAWRERNGRANRIGDCDDDGKIPDWAIKSFRDRHPERSGDYTSAPAANTRHGGDRHSGGRYDLGYWVPHRIS